MKQLTHFLQHPILKIFVSPIAIILFGTLTGIIVSGTFNWLGFILLALVAISSHLIAHYFNLDVNRHNKMNQGILYACEAVMIIAILGLAFTNHWLITALLVLYAVYIHIIYLPYNISGTWYHIILSVFYNTLFLNIAAYFIQSSNFEIGLLTQYIPLVLFYVGSQFEIFNLQSRLNRRKNQVFYQRYLNLGLMGAGIIVGLLQSFPSSTYFIVQILFVILSAVIILPLVVSTNKSHQMQNKINYISAVFLLFNIFYSLSVMF